jgi:tetratricopeptide (TPR) repeat protein
MRLALVLIAAATFGQDLAQQGAAALREGRFDEAERIFRQLLKESPGHPGLRLNLGLALHSKGQHAAAVTELEAFLKANPAPGPVYLVLGAAKLKLGRHCDAVPALEKARQWQASERVLTELGDAYQGCKRYGDAAKAYVAARQPRAAARAYWNARVYGRAKPLFESVAAANGSDPEFLYEYGDTLARLDGAASGLPLLEKSVALQPGLIPARGALGRALLEEGRAEESIPHLAAAAPADVTLLMPLSRALKAAGRLEEAARVETEYRKKLSGQN